MSVKEKILTLHPQGKNGVNIDKEVYDLFYHHIQETLQQNPGLTFYEMSGKIGEKLTGSFKGSIPWYSISVKLDMEARGILTTFQERGKKRLYIS